MPNNQKLTLPKQANFEVFRYQLVVDKVLQLNMYDYKSAEDIRADKNKILQKLITDDTFKFYNSQSEIYSKLLHTNGTLSYFRLGVKRNTKVFKKDFSEDYIENYPNIIVAINNDPNVQKIAIQSNTHAFQDCNTVSHIIQKTIDPKIKKSNLSFFVEPLFDKQEFWNLIKKYPKQVKQVTFNLISPNLANISKNLKLDLKSLYEDTNTLKTKVELNADEESYLDIKENSTFVNSLVDYSADGGGNIQMRVKGIRKALHTAQSPSDFNVDELLLKSENWDELDRLFNDILI
ncbi:MAG: hypothetical protein Q8928_00545 [Bacteroidota bacterium]|nr:hypothetical protein [Bacteroidota bacterium]